MLDIKFIQENIELVKKAVQTKHVEVSIDTLLGTYKQRNEFQQKLEFNRAESNQINNQIKQADTSSRKKILARAKKIKIKGIQLEKNFKKLDATFQKLLLLIPNIPTVDTPIGKDESENVVLKKVGTPKNFSFKPKHHSEIGEMLDILDIEKAVKISGSRFAYLKNELVLLQFAIISFVLSIVTNEKKLAKIFKNANISIPSTPFTPILPPVFIRSKIFENMGRLEPKEDKYELPNDNLFLIGSAEHTLGPLHMNETIPKEKLPLRYIGYSTCFRREAGTYGKDMKGLIRLHQFDKMEMESFTTKEQGLEEQQGLIAIQEHIMQALELPYQVVSICTGDMGMPDAKQVDIETWMPGQKLYRETHSADYIGDFQPRRLKTNIKNGTVKELVHMNDATAVAFSRTLAAILENYQTKEGTVHIPKILKPFMHGIKEIKRS